MAALRAALANERSANIEEKHSQLDEHHVEGLWVGVSVSENTPSETFFEAISTHPDVLAPRRPRETPSIRCAARGARGPSSAPRRRRAAAAPGCRSSAAARRRSSSSIKIRIRGPTALNCVPSPRWRHDGCGALAAGALADRGAYDGGGARSRNGPRLGKCRNQSRYRSPASTACGARRAPPGPWRLPEADAVAHCGCGRGCGRGRGACAGSSERAQCQPPRRTVASRAPRRAKRCPLRQALRQEAPRTCARGISPRAPRLLADDATTERPAGDASRSRPPRRYGGLS